MLQKNCVLLSKMTHKSETFAQIFYVIFQSPIIPIFSSNVQVWKLINHFSLLQTKIGINIDWLLVGKLQKMTDSNKIELTFFTFPFLRKTLVWPPINHMMELASWEKPYLILILIYSWEKHLLDPQSPKNGPSIQLVIILGKPYLILIHISSWGNHLLDPNHP